MSGQVNSALKFLMHYGMVTQKCADNCSGHGECQNGTCFCEVFAYCTFIVSFYY